MSDVETRPHVCQVIGCDDRWMVSENWSGRYQCDKHLTSSDDERLSLIEKRMETMEAQLARIETILGNTERIIAGVASEVMPTVEALSKNPMVRALGIGGKFGGKNG